jgi:3-hydroxymyristoyl/3-hydroxydecanoyl-(acyl carrier protein) dehydratase
MDSSLQVATALPRDPDGTLARERLLRLFGRNANGRLPSQRLLFRESTPDGVRTFRTKVPADFFGFEGHFPPYPVLSGAVQLHELVLPCVRAEIGEGVETAGFQDLKFLARIAPGDTVVVAVRRDHVRGTCDFEITRGTVKCSTGRVLLRGAGQRP